MNYDKNKIHPLKAVLFTIFSLILFVGLIWFVVNMISTEIPEIEHVFQNTAIYAVILGIPLAITIGITNYFGKGDKNRLVFGLISSVIFILYFVVVLGSINLGFEGEDFTYTLTITGIIVLTVIACSIRGAFFALEFYTYQKDTKTKGVQKEEHKEVEYY